MQQGIDQINKKSQANYAGYDVIHRRITYSLSHAFAKYQHAARKTLPAAR
jgi:hypothetical protein